MHENGLEMCSFFQSQCDFWWPNFRKKILLLLQSGIIIGHLFFAFIFDPKNGGWVFTPPTTWWPDPNFLVNGRSERGGTIVDCIKCFMDFAPGAFPPSFPMPVPQDAQSFPGAFPGFHLYLQANLILSIMTHLNKKLTVSLHWSPF